MAATNKLPIYSVCYSVTKKSLHAVVSIPRSYRYTIGDEIRKAAIELLHLIIEINEEFFVNDKLKLMDKFGKIYNRLATDFDLCIDMCLLPRKKMEDLLRDMSNLSKQFHKWKQYYVNTKNGKNTKKEQDSLPF